MTYCYLTRNNRALLLVLPEKISPKTD